MLVRLLTRPLCRGARSNFASPNWCRTGGFPSSCTTKAKVGQRSRPIRLGEFGYENVSILDGGLPGWRKEGLPTVSGVNVPSKAFGEKVHHERTIPEISPEELKSLQEQPPI